MNMTFGQVNANLAPTTFPIVQNHFGKELSIIHMCLKFDLPCKKRNYGDLVQNLEGHRCVRNFFATIQKD